MGTGELGRSDMIIKWVKNILVTTYDGGDLHILNVMAKNYNKFLSLKKI